MAKHLYHKIEKKEKKALQKIEKNIVI